MQRPMLGAQRRIEGRIGQLLGPAKVGSHHSATAEGGNGGKEMTDHDQSFDDRQKINFRLLVKLNLRVGKCYIPRDMEITLNFVAEIDPVAIYAALVATTILIWDVVKWLRSGPRIKVRMNPNMKIINDPDPRRTGKTFIYVIVTNVGFSPTTITNFGGVHFRNRWDQLRRKPDKQFYITSPEAAQHLPLPHVLKVGEEWSGLIGQTPEIVQMAKNGLLYAVVFQSVKRRPVSVRIIIPDS